VARARPAEPRPVRPPPDWEVLSGLESFHRQVGFRVDPKQTHHGVCTVVGKVERRHLNINQVVHGGVYATILDTAMGGAVVTMLGPSETTATTSLYVEFVRPAREGQHLRARGEVIRRGRHLAFVRGDLYDEFDRRMSQAHGTWYIWSSGEGTWESQPGAVRPKGRRAPVKPQAKRR